MLRPGLLAVLRHGLLDRRKRLIATILLVPNGPNIQQLLQEVDAALDRLTTGGYGLCETCNEPIEKDRLKVDPLLRYCTAHFAPEEQLKFVRDWNLAHQLGIVAPEELGEPLEVAAEEAADPLAHHPSDVGE